MTRPRAAGCHSTWRERGEGRGLGALKPRRPQDQEGALAHGTRTRKQRRDAAQPSPVPPKGGRVCARAHARAINRDPQTKSNFQKSHFVGSSSSSSFLAAAALAGGGGAAAARSAFSAARSAALARRLISPLLSAAASPAPGADASAITNRAQARREKPTTARDSAKLKCAVASGVWRGARAHKDCKSPFWFGWRQTWREVCWTRPSRAMLRPLRRVLACSETSAYRT